MSSRTDARSRGLAHRRCFVHRKDAQWEYRSGVCADQARFLHTKLKKKKSLSLQTKVIKGFRPQASFFFLHRGLNILLDKLYKVLNYLKQTLNKLAPGFLHYKAFQLLKIPK